MTVLCYVPFVEIAMNYAMTGWNAQTISLVGQHMKERKKLVPVPTPITWLVYMKCYSDETAHEQKAL